MKRALKKSLNGPLELGVIVSREHHPHAQAREWALQFLYQCEVEKLYFFSEAHFERFVTDFSVEKAHGKVKLALTLIK